MIFLLVVLISNGTTSINTKTYDSMGECLHAKKLVVSTEDTIVKDKACIKF